MQHELLDLESPRMVLDAKSGSHNDYGSIGCGTNGGSEGAEQPAQLTQPNVPSNSNNQQGMSGGDVYQRQPLLGGGGVGEDWNSPVDLMPNIEEDDNPEDKRRTASVIATNGAIVRIDMSGAIREEPKFPKEKWKTVNAFLILVFNFIVTTGSLALVHERVPDKDKVAPLPDSVLDTFSGKYPWALYASEIIIMISTNVTFLVIFLHKHRYIIFRRLFLMLSLLYLMRSITMYVTVLPMSNPDYYCSPKANSTSVVLVTSRIFQLISGFGLSINGRHTFCGDYIYSGHTVILVMSYLIINEYSPKKMVILHWISWTASFSGIVLVLLARGHYTIDVLIAYYATTRTFWIYHTLANHPGLKTQSSNNLLSRLWWFSLFQYFEGNVGGVIPRKFNWPLPWPRRFHSKHPNRDS